MSSALAANIMNSRRRSPIVFTTSPCDIATLTPLLLLLLLDSIMSDQVMLVLMLLCTCTDTVVVRFEESYTDILTSIDLSYLKPSAERLRSHSTEMLKNDKLRLVLTHSEGLSSNELSATQQTGHTPLDIYTHMTVDLQSEATHLIHNANSLLGLARPQGSDSRRRSRSIDFIGRMWHQLSGSPGPDQAKAYDQSTKDIKSALKTQTKFNSKLIGEQKVEHKILARNTAALRDLSIIADSMQSEIENSINNDIALANQIAYLQTLGSWGRRISNAIFQAELIISEGKSGFLSTSALTSTELTHVLRRIESKEHILSPLYSSQYPEMYYVLPLTTVYMSPNGFLHVALRVPLVDFREINNIRPISKEEKDSDPNGLYPFDYVITNSVRRQYTLLTETELANCFHLEEEQEYVCDYRKAQISMPQCSNCSIFNPMAVVHRVDNEQFIIKIADHVTTILSCAGVPPKKIVITENRIASIPTHCSLSCQHFMIPRVPAHYTQARTNFSLLTPDESFSLLRKKGFAHESIFNFTFLEENISDLATLEKTNADLEGLNADLKSEISQVKVVGGALFGGYLLIFLLCGCLTLKCISANAGLFARATPCIMLASLLCSCKKSEKEKDPENIYTDPKDTQKDKDSKGTTLKL